MNNDDQFAKIARRHPHGGHLSNKRAAFRPAEWRFRLEGILVMNGPALRRT